MARYAKETSLNQDISIKTSRKGVGAKVAVVFMICYVRGLKLNG